MAIAASPQPTFDAADRYFLILRAGCVVAAALWLWQLVAPGSAGKGSALVALFIVYSLALYLWAWRYPSRRARAYLTAMPADLVFLFLVCWWSAEPLSGVYLAFYLLIAFHAFYFGARIGLATASGFAGLYTFLCFSLPPPERCLQQELLLRLGFAFLIALSLALISWHMQANRDYLREANRQLQHRNRTLEQTYRHLSLGRLAGDVAHNINNPAAAIVGKAEVMRRRAERDGLPPAYLEDLAAIAEHALRIARVVRSLVALSPQRDAVARSLDIGLVAEGVALLLEDQAAQKGASITRRLEGGLQVHGDESSLQQVIFNLVSNALDALDQHGEVVVETRPGPEPQTVELRVRDNGQGILPQHLDSVFSPFFSTKKGGDGVGLGLSLSLAIVQRLGGTMSVESTPGIGSTFTVTLPVDAGSTLTSGPV